MSLQYYGDHPGPGMLIATHEDSQRLPTIEEDESFEESSSPMSSLNSDSPRSDSAFGPLDGGLRDAHLACFDCDDAAYAGHPQHPYQQQQHMALDAAAAAEGVLLAAIDMRLQELLRMREQCHAAAAAQHKACNNATPTPNAVSAAAGRIAAAKLAEIRAVQRMQLAIQHELLQLLSQQQ